MYYTTLVIFLKLFVYGTVFNNIKWLDLSINSIKLLDPAGIFVVDNFSTDGTYEKLKSMSKVHVIHRKCSHGYGRQLALEELLKYSEDDDFVMYMDFDTIYKKSYIKLIGKTMKILDDKEVFIFGMLSKACANKYIPWRDMLTSEDLERHAHFKSSGYKIIGTKEQFMMLYGGTGLHNPYYDNDLKTGSNFYKRHSRYKVSTLRFMIRMFKVLIDNERGVAFKSFSEFYQQSNDKRFSRKLIFLIAYLLAKLLGVYSYSRSFNNIEYVMNQSA